MTARLPSPPQWLPLAAADLAVRLPGREIGGVVGGPGWLSLRVGEEFLWIVVHRGLRMLWLSPRPLPAQWLDFLGRHRRSAFAFHLRGRHVTTVRLLVDSEGSAEGVGIAFSPGPAQELGARFWPRPGGIWVRDARGQILAQQGRMDGPPSLGVEPGPVYRGAADEHHRRCEERLLQDLEQRVEQGLRRTLERSIGRLRRRQLAMEAEHAEALRDQSTRTQADLLAAHLHELRPGQRHAELQDFEGRPVRLELDPALSAAGNLQALYRKASRAERRLRALEERLLTGARELERSRAERERLRLCESLDDLIALASELKFTPEITQTEGPGGQRGERSRRLPYWTFRRADWELRVGRSAKDNDLLLSGHSKGRDLWLHAQGVGGSHAVLRSAGRQIPRRIVEECARIAAQYSKARTSALVPVVYTERRFVRKPRRAAPGEVRVDRGQTIFVEPGIPPGWTDVSRNDTD